MKNKQLINFEEKLLNFGFKKVLLWDHSGYWFSMKFNIPIFNWVDCCVEPDNKKMFFTVDGDGDWATKTYKVRKFSDCITILQRHNLIYN